MRAAYFSLFWSSKDEKQISEEHSIRLNQPTIIGRKLNSLWIQLLLLHWKECMD